MITKTTNLGSDYAALFAEINRQDPSLNINSLEEFFGKIVEIKALNTKYLRLPLDEPMFEIDANSRKIEVPTAFKNNGVSVQNDHLAETLFFKIDRYFDYMDLLAGDMDISIKWKIGSSQQGISKCFIKSGDIVPGCIVFGWPISEAMTGVSGTLTFSVSFTKKNDDGAILYSFNTLPTTIIIKEGLKLANTAEVFDMSSNLLNILSNSSFGENSARVDDVIWVAQPHVSGSTYAANIDLDFSSANDNVVSVVAKDLYAVACAGRGASINYYDEENNILTESIVYVAEENEAVLNDQVRYYVKPDPNVNVYVVAQQADIDKWGTANQVALYMKAAKLSVDDCGTYSIKAQGVKQELQGTNLVTIGASSTAVSQTVTVPQPEPIASITVEAEQTLNIEEVYPSEVANYSFDNNTIKYINDSKSVNVNVSTDSSAGGKVKYTVCKYVDGAYVDVANSAIQVISNSYTTSLNAEGKYAVKAQHYKNGKISSITMGSDIVEVSELVSTFELTPFGEFTAELNASNNATTSVELTLSANAPVKSDGLILELYECDGENKVKVYDQTTELAVLSSQTLSAPITYRASRGVPSTLKDGHSYCFKVINKYNGSYYSQFSSVFTLNIISN